MRVLKWLLIAVVLLLAVFIIGGLLLPERVHVERAAVVNAPAGAIFPYVNNFRRFNEWSPWAARDPDTEYVFEGPESGEGAIMTWRSDHDQVGSGTQRIEESVTNERVVTALDFGEMGKARAIYRLEPVDGGTRVIWSLDSQLPPSPTSRWMGLALERLVGAEYEKGLQNLKAKVEATAAQK